MDRLTRCVGNNKGDECFWADARKSFDNAMDDMTVSKTTSGFLDGMEVWFDQDSKNFNGKCANKNCKSHKQWCAEKGCQSQPLWLQSVCADHQTSSVSSRPSTNLATVSNRGAVVLFPEEYMCPGSEGSDTHRRVVFKSVETQLEDITSIHGADEEKS